MSRGIKIALIALIAVVVAAGIMFLIWALIYKPPIIFQPEVTPPVTETDDEDGLPPTGGGTIGEVATTTDDIEIDFEVSTPEEVELQRVKNLSSLFTERFGSYSNQGDFENVSDLMPLMTGTLQAWAEGYIEENTALDDSVYFGVSTKALATEVISFDPVAGRAEINVQAQRTEVSSEGTKTYNQTLNIRLVKSGNEWLIDFIKWQ